MLLVRVETLGQRLNYRTVCEEFRIDLCGLRHIMPYLAGKQPFGNMLGGARVPPVEGIVLYYSRDCFLMKCGAKVPNLSLFSTRHNSGRRPLSYPLSTVRSVLSFRF